MSLNYCIGLTGGVASGKSTVAEEFSRLGVPLIDADQAARDVVEPGSAGLDAVVAHFGSQVLLPDGGLDRAAMRRIVFADESRRRELESLLHPLIRQCLRDWHAAQSAAYGIMVVPILIEGGFDKLVDRILVVDVPESVQVARLIQRDDIDVELAQQMLAAQLSRSQRLALADDTLDNAGPVAELPELVRRLHEKYMRLATNTGSP